MCVCDEKKLGWVFLLAKHYYLVLLVIIWITGSVQPKASLPVGCSKSQVTPTCTPLSHDTLHFSRFQGVAFLPPVSFVCILMLIWYNIGISPLFNFLLHLHITHHSKPVNNLPPFLFLLIHIYFFPQTHQPHPLFFHLFHSKNGNGFLAL